MIDNNKTLLNSREKAHLKDINYSCKSMYFELTAWHCGQVKVLELCQAQH